MNQGVSNSIIRVATFCTKTTTQQKQPQSQQQAKTVSFVMIFSEDIEKYIPVGDTIVGKKLFHTNQLIYTLDEI